MMERYNYNRSAITPGIAHFGVGNFHRSHQAMYLDRLLGDANHQNWGIVGIGVMPGDVRMRDALASQDFRYTLVEKHGDGTVAAREIRSICDMLIAPEDPERVLRQLSDPSIRIVSLTITEGGYNIDRDSGEFDLANPIIQRDIANPHNPTSVFGYIVEALRRRRMNGTSPFTVMSCDNLPGNGEVAKCAILTFAQAVDTELARWIEAEVAFPNSMVDRITPVTTDADREFVRSEFDMDDAWPVITEPFTQWVLEDHFCNGRPSFESVGVQMVDDVMPYELMKLRLLNASHQAMAYIGILAGHTYVHEAVGNEGIERFLRAWLAEARATLPPVPGIDLDSYIESLFDRFRNPYIADTLARLAVDASDRIPKFLLPAIRENLAAGRKPMIGAAIIASWMVYIERDNVLVDPMAQELQRSTIDPETFVGNTAIFGDLGTNPAFTNTVSTLRANLQSQTVADWLKMAIHRS